MLYNKNNCSKVWKPWFGALKNEYYFLKSTRYGKMAASRVFHEHGNFESTLPIPKHMQVPLVVGTLLLPWIDMVWTFFFS